MEVILDSSPELFAAAAAVRWTRKRNLLITPPAVLDAAWRGLADANLLCGGMRASEGDVLRQSTDDRGQQQREDSTHSGNSSDGGNPLTA